MQARSRILSGLLAALTATAALAARAEAPAGGEAALSYPPTPVHVVVDDYFGTRVEDPYRWLENNQDPEVAAWTEAENAVTRKFLDAVPALPAIRRELTALWNYPKMGAPVRRGEYLFYTKNEGLQNQSSLYVRRGRAPARLLIDPNALSSDGTVAMDWWYPSEDGRYVAYGTSPNGTEQSVLRTRDSATGKDLADVIDGCRFSSVAWLKDGSGFYYTRFPKPGTVPQNEMNYDQRVLFHKLGTDPEEDTPVFSVPAEKEVLFGLDLSKHDRYLLITANKGSSSTNEVFVKDLRTGGILQLVLGFHDTYSGEILDGTFYCLTNEGAPNGKVFAVDLRRPQREHWREIIPEGKDAVQSLQILDGRIALQVLHDATARVRFYGRDGAFEREMPLPENVDVYGLSGRWDSPEIFVEYAGFTAPASVHRYDFEKNALEPYFAPEVSFDGAAYETEQVWYPSKDGTRISMFVVHRRGLKLDGTNPCWLTGYGGFDVSMLPYYSPSVAWWLERDGVFAMPNLRGGGEYGEAWHKAGMLGKKQAVFDDFIAAAQWLIAKGYTSTPKLAIEGGSNGGLLTGACLTQRPDLYGCVIVEVPLLDMLRYQDFSIARYWVPEYGSSENPEQFKTLMAYSPYQHVKKGTAYPPTLIMQGADDNRVDPMHARKMTALLQADSAGPGPILLRMESKAGHGQGMPTAKRIEEAADRFAFMVKALGVKVTTKPTS